MTRPFRLAALVSVGCLALGAGSHATKAAEQTKLVPQVAKPQRFGVSLPARAIPLRPPRETKPEAEQVKKRRNPPVREIRFPRPENFQDPVVQTEMPEPLGVVGMPPLSASFDGVSNAVNQTILGAAVVPPDTNGDVGPNHYVQTVNLFFQVFSKTGTSLAGPMTISTLYTGFGGPCETSDDGDPIVVYDQLADRWLISQFALPNFPAGPYHQCIAVSTSGDPAGTYFLYDYIVSNNELNDYPHFGVWPDAYYMTVNQFFNAGNFDGTGAFAFDRNKMLAGDPSASFIYFNLNLASHPEGIGGLLPSHLNGPPPPLGTPNYLSYFTSLVFGDPQDGLRIFEFHPDFTIPANSTFTERADSPLAVAAFDPNMCGFSRACIPQPPSVPPASPPTCTPAPQCSNLDAISDRLMYRLQYRNFGTYESLVVNHTVDVGADHAGVRYYQLKRLLPVGTFTVNEQATFAPDAAHRWMGSAAMDGQGNLAVGFSVSSSSVFPSIRYAGRLFSDPPNQLTQGEASLIAGSNSQTTGAARWGDYSSMSIDPTDDCTFWYTQEYYNSAAPACPFNNFRCWQTRIGAFKFPACTSSTVTGTLQGTVTNSLTTAPIAGVLVQTSNGFARTTDAAGFYSMVVPAGTYNMTASKVGYATGTASGVVVPPAGTTTQDFALVGVPIIVFNSSAVDDSGQGGNNNGVIDVNECCNINLSLANTGGGAATGVGATITTSTPGVTILQGASTYPDIPAGGNATNITPFRIQTAPSFLAGTRINISMAVTTAQGPFTVPVQLNTSAPSGASSSFSATGPVPIPDNNPTGAVLNIPVSGFSSAISKVVVQLRITHTFDSDLTISLIGPDATAVNLSVQRGGGGDNFGTDCPASSNDTVFDDAAATPISAGTAPFVGTFRPDQPLSAFVGKPANGMWQLKVVDSFAIDTGNIECVTLVINGFTVASGGCQAGADFNGDGKTDILWRRGVTGDNLVWFMNGTTVAGGAVLTAVGDTNWKIVGTADFNGDGKVDILWRNQATGDNVVWFMNGTTISGGAVLTAVADTKWRIVATGDFNGDGKPDILWRHAMTGDNLVWFMNGTTISGGAVLTSVADPNWNIVGAGDFNGDAKTDILWRHQVTGDNLVWFMNGTTISGGAVLTAVGDTNWKIVAVGDFNGDGKPDIVWRHAVTGDDLVWLMNGTTIASGAVLPTVGDVNWNIVGPK